MAIDLKQDSLNVIDLSDLGVSMQAIEDKIIILVDPYKSGLECKVCKGTGKVASSVVEGALKDCTAPGCVKGDVLVIPDIAKSAPSTGVIVSMGPETKFMRLKHDLKRNHIDKMDYDEEMENCFLQIGTRVVFGVHVGTKIPIKGNIKLTIMREKEPLCIVFGSDLGDKEIIDYTQENI